MPPVAGSAGGGLDLKRLPPWAWAVAIAGGAVVGFVFLRSPSSSSDQASSDQASSDQGAAPSESVSPVVANPLDALGLTSGFQFPSYSSGLSGGGGAGGAGDTGADTSGSTLTTTNLFSSAVRSTSPLWTTQTTYQSALAPKSPTVPFLGGLVNPGGAGGSGGGSGGRLIAS